jgi:hypothetical protein
MPEGRVIGFDQDEGGEAAVVERTGLALVEAGEVVLRPAEGSEAAASIVAHEDRVIVNYFFPVEIEVRGAGAPIDPDEIVARAIRGVAQGVESVLL